MENKTNKRYFIIKGVWTLVFIFIVISTMYLPICLPAFFRCLSNLGTYRELRTMSFIESTGVTCSDSICHNWVQVLSIPVWLMESEPATPVDSIKDVVWSSMKVPEFDKHLKKARGHIGQNVVEITIKMKTIVRKP